MKRWLIGACLALLAVPAMANPQLANLSCVYIAPNLTKDTRGLGLTTELIRDTVLVKLKANAPSLKIRSKSDCNNFVWVSVSGNRQHYENDSETGAVYGAVDVALYRLAVLEETGTYVNARAWSINLSYSTPKEVVRRLVMENIDETIIKLAADYYRAGNE